VRAQQHCDGRKQDERHSNDCRPAEFGKRRSFGFAGSGGFETSLHAAEGASALGAGSQALPRNAGEGLRDGLWHNRFP
jgi:hypothetical protein